MEVYKFGGASVKDAAGIKNVSDIISKQVNPKLLVVVSATGKTTNALQLVLNDHYDETKDPFKSLMNVKENHLELINQLFGPDEDLKNEILDTFVEIDWILEEEAHPSFDFEYDQIVSVGELVSSKILYRFLQKLESKVAWLDVRDVILTDNTYREANLDWKVTEERIKSKTEEMFAQFDIIVTQGFIAASSENFTTTLGREGSDFTASIFSFCLDAERLTIWKDVPGVLTADPRLFNDVDKLEKLSYREAIEMTYYGAKVIHPKTIKPLQNKGIPLYVKSFVESEGKGTLISYANEINIPPIIVFEHNQCLFKIATKDFSFVAEDHLSTIFQRIAKHRVKIKMMKNTAVSFIFSVDQNKRIDGLLKDLEEEFNVQIEKDLELMTIRHFTEEVIEKLTKGRKILFEERIPQTIQMIVHRDPSINIKNL